MKILFLGKTNACRTQMAAGWSRYLSTIEVDIYSAGIESHGKNPRAVITMLESGIDISKQESTPLKEEMLIDLDYLITVDMIPKEQIMQLSDSTQFVYWSIENPAKTGGSRDDIKQQYRVVREQIRDMVLDLFDKLGIPVNKEVN
jgi:arsenate reductase